MMSSAGLWMGSLGLSMGFFVFYFIYRGGHDNRLDKSLIYRDLSTETVTKTVSVNAFCPSRLSFFSSITHV
jgi:hypothetical protein